MTDQITIHLGVDRNHNHIHIRGLDQGPDQGQGPDRGQDLGPGPGRQLNQDLITPSLN